MQQLFVEQLPQPDAPILLGGPEAHYLGRSLRARPGERFRLADAGGNAVVAVLLAFEGGAARLQWEAADPDKADSFVLSLELCAPRGEALDEALDLAVQLGVERVTLLRSERTLVALGPEGFKRDRLERRIREACRQCLRARIPVLAEPQSLEDALARDGDGRKLLLSERGGVPLAQAAGGAGRGTAFRLVVGPEGGFTAAEHELAQRLRWTAVTLGPRPLRVPAAVAAAMGGLRALQVYA